MDGFMRVIGSACAFLVGSQAIFFYVIEKKNNCYTLLVKQLPII